MTIDESLASALKRALAKWGTRWTRKLEAVAKELAREFAIRSRRDYDLRLRKILRDAGMTVRFQPTPAMKEAYRAVLAENVNLIRSIPQKFLKDVESSVWVGVMRGGDMEYISRELQKNYGVSYRRAALIARDQESKARAVMERARRLELGITQAVWRHSHAGVHPRPSHVAMDGKTYDIAKGMWDPDVGRYVLPGELIGCRCSSKAVIP
ncbi:MAG: phage minor head protein [Steroidobacteraceae bacterium]